MERGHSYTIGQCTTPHVLRLHQAALVWHCVMCRYAEVHRDIPEVTYRNINAITANVCYTVDMNETQKARFEYLANLHFSGAYMNANEREEFVRMVNGD